MDINFGKRYNLDNLEATFRNYLIQEHVSTITLKNYISDIRHFFGWFSLSIESRDANPEKSLTQNIIGLFLNNGAVEQYKTYLITNNLPIKTVNRRLSTLRKFCSFAITQGWIKENVAKKVSNINLTPANVISNPSLSFRTEQQIGTGSVRNPASKTGAPIKNAEFIPPKAGLDFSATPRNDILNEFKQNLLSQQSDPKETDLLTEDVYEFLTFINS